LGFTLNDVTAVTLFYKTKDLIDLSIKSFRKYYPSIPLVIVDNSDGDDCTIALRDFVNNDNYSTLIETGSNLGHGAGLDVGIRNVSSKLIYIFESDVFMKVPGLIEELISIVGDKTYGVSEIHWVTYDKPFSDVSRDFIERKKMRYIWIYAGLLSKDKYLEFPPLGNDQKTNAFPIGETMRSIHDKGDDELLVDFDLSKYVTHLYGGTRCRYGIGGEGNYVN